MDAPIRRKPRCARLCGEWTHRGAGNAGSFEPGNAPNKCVRQEGDNRVIQFGAFHGVRTNFVHPSGLLDVRQRGNLGRACALTPRARMVI